MLARVMMAGILPRLARLGGARLRSRRVRLPLGGTTSPFAPRPALRRVWCCILGVVIEAAQLEKILPHRYPFLFLDRVIEVVPGESIVALRLVSNSDPILQGHFPGNPIVPGVVQVEAMAQAALVLAHASGHFDPERHNCYFIGIQDAKFRGLAVPGEVLRIEVKAERIGRVGKFSGQVTCEGKVKSSATFTAIIDAKPVAAPAP